MQYNRVAYLEDTNVEVLMTQNELEKHYIMPNSNPL